MPPDSQWLWAIYLNDLKCENNIVKNKIQKKGRMAE